jgi:hypothetical protein
VEDAGLLGIGREHHVKQDRGRPGLQEAKADGEGDEREQKNNANPIPAEVG